MIDTFTISTCMGETRDSLPFLTEWEYKEFNTIGYTGKDFTGNKISRVDYLNSLKRGEFAVNQIKYDNGDFCERFIITRAYTEKKKSLRTGSIDPDLGDAEFCGIDPQW